MKSTVTLTVTSLLTILFATFHLTDDATLSVVFSVRGLWSLRRDQRA